LTCIAVLYCFQIKYRLICKQYDTIFLTATAAPPTRFARMLSVLSTKHLRAFGQKGNAVVDSNTVYSLNLK